MEIIKKNQLNKKGILIEYDAGYISPKDNRHFINEVSKLTEGQPIIEEPLVVYAVMQKYGVDFKSIKSHAMWFTRGVIGGKKVREGISRCRRVDDVVKLVKRFQ